MPMPILKVGITGGIGSGKSTVCQVFETLGIPVFYADEAARRLMEEDPELVKGITALFGAEAYYEGKLNRQHIAGLAFSKPELLQELNALTHPATIRYGHDWFNRQQTPYAIKEAALFFESGSAADIDVMIGVAAPRDLRLQRAMQRDHASRETIEARMARQMDEDEKMSRCDHIIHNDERQAIIPQVLVLHELLLKQAKDL